MITSITPMRDGYIVSHTSDGSDDDADLISVAAEFGLITADFHPAPIERIEAKLEQSRAWRAERRDERLAWREQHNAEQVATSIERVPEPA